MTNLPRIGARKLLRMVNGKKHASSEDHFEDDPDMARAYFGDNARSHKTMDEADITADPASSSDEMPREPLPDPQQPNIAVTKRTAPVQNIFAPPQGTSSKRSPRPSKINAPKAGTHRNTRADKARPISKNEDKENASRSSPTSASKRSADDSDGPFGGMEYGNRTKLRRIEKTRNSLFSKPLSAPQQTFGKQKSYRSKLFSRPANNTKPRPTMDDRLAAGSGNESDSSACSMLSLPEVKSKVKRKLARQRTDTSEPEEELLDIKIPKGKGKKKTSVTPPKPRPTLSFLDAYKNPQRSQTSERTVSEKPNLDPNGSDNGTPPSSLDSAHEQERVEDLEQYLADQQPIHSDDTCPMCAEAVDQTFYWDWWKGKSDTIRNQSLFCKAHNRQTAMEEYKKKAYPVIDWSAIPDRIQQHHTHLIDVLEDRKDSFYRRALEEKAAQGRLKVNVQEFMKKDDSDKIAMLKRTAKKVNNRSEDAVLFQGLSEDEDEDEDEDSSIPDSHTGYYGARGAQLFASAIVTQLREPLSASESDPAVSFGGVGYFVQRVLVPECAVRLVMQDMDVSEAVARNIIEESARVGRLVNEEVEDSVATGGSDHEEHDNIEDEEDEEDEEQE